MDHTRRTRRYNKKSSVTEDKFQFIHAPTELVSCRFCQLLTQISDFSRSAMMRVTRGVIHRHSGRPVSQQSQSHPPSTFLLRVFLCTESSTEIRFAHENEFQYCSRYSNFLHECLISQQSTRKPTSKNRTSVTRPHSNSCGNLFDDKEKDHDTEITSALSPKGK